MQKPPGRRARRRKLLTMTAAERMRRMRERRRAQGLKAAVTWVPRRRVAQIPPLELRLLQARSLAAHVMAARKIDCEPALLETVRDNLAQWCKRGSGQAGVWKRRWSAVLDQPWPAIAALMTEQSERGVRLRQATPFLCVLSARERRKIYGAFRVVKTRPSSATLRGDRQAGLPQGPPTAMLS